MTPEKCCMQSFTRAHRGKGLWENSCCGQGPGKVAWTHGHVRELAAGFQASLPQSVLSYINDEWRGGNLLKLEDSPTRPIEKDLVQHAMWLRPVLRLYPKTATQFLLPFLCCLDLLLTAGQG